MLVILPALLLAAATPAGAKVGYGYARSEDPLILGIKRIILSARLEDWPAARREFEKLNWLFVEFRADLQVDIQDPFAKALSARSLEALSAEISRVLYFALKQKFHWNIQEQCLKFVPAKSRVEAARFYYEEILAIGVKDYDQKNRKSQHKKILARFDELRRAVGTAGLFGLGARPPDLEAFQAGSKSILDLLGEVFPHLAAKDKDSAGAGKPPEDGRAPKPDRSRK